MPSPKNIPRTCHICDKEFLARKHEVEKGYAKYCSINCRNEGNKRPVEERFWEKVDRSDKDGCWLWKGAKRHSSGYGGFWDGSKWTHAHRVSYELFNGHIPGGFEVIHVCDNPGCIRPDHLVAGTHQDNMNDSKEKGRSVGGFYNISKKNRPIGEKHGLAKLTANDVREIRKLYDEGTKITAIARKYQMGHAQIGAIARRKAWKHIK